MRKSAMILAGLPAMSNMGMAADEGECGTQVCTEKQGQVQIIDDRRPSGI